MSAWIQFSSFLPGHGQLVFSTYGYPDDWAVNFTIHGWAEAVAAGSPPRMGLAVPVGAEGQPDQTQTYFLAIQNTGDNAGGFDCLVQAESL